MPRKSRNNVKRQQLEHLEMSLVLNGKAIDEKGSKKKHWSIHDLKSIRPLNYAQEELFHAWFNGFNILAHGSAGTGKTYIGLYLALSEILREQSSLKRLIICRSAVPTRDLGFLPGTFDEKISVYEAPYRDILCDIVGKSSSYDDMKEARIIEFMPTSFLRGLTWDDSVVIVDEIQSMTFHEINSIITRLGKNSKIMLLGDLAQNDLIYRKGESSGMGQLLKVMEQMTDDFAIIPFNHNDIVRSGLCKSWIIACESLISVAA